jgi:hypothetical protein
MTQEPQHKEIWTVRSEWSTENNGDTYEVKDLIVFNKEQVIEYLKNNYDIERDGTQDYSDGEESLCFSYSGIYDEIGREIKHNFERCYESEDRDQIKEGFYEQTDSISAYKDYTIVNEAQITELKTTFSGHVVIDLTEE